MAVQTRNITVTIFDNDGTALEGARVKIKLIGLGNEPGGAVSPGEQIELTDENGIASFVLWENRLDYSDTYYEVSSYHPTTNIGIHKREVFYVGDSDADVKDLINVSGAQLDPTQALLAQIAAAYADRFKWDGGPDGLVAATGLVSLGAAKRTITFDDPATTYDVLDTDDGLYRRMTNPAEKTVTVRPSSTHDLPTGGTWPFKNVGVGNLTFVEGSEDVTINPPHLGTLVVPQNGAVALQQVGPDEYDLLGQTVPA